ncbi:MAG: NUDIX hydrolase [Pseudonocardiales bacterium]|nr:MAG: NUDIX hydrolase [Pseudonocardiales bacterium]
MTAAQPIDRPGVRVLLIDGRDRVLLFRARDPGRPTEPPYWFTVGGGLDSAETSEQAALREMFEETGLVRAAEDLAGPVWHEVAEFGFDGASYRQSQDFFVCRVDTWQVDTSAFEEPEIRSIEAHRWWSIAELEATDEVFYPEILPGLLRRVLGMAG